MVSNQVATFSTIDKSNWNLAEHLNDLYANTIGIIIDNYEVTALKIENDQITKHMQEFYDSITKLIKEEKYSEGRLEPDTELITYNKLSTFRDTVILYDSLSPDFVGLKYDYHEIMYGD